MGDLDILCCGELSIDEISVVDKRADNANASVKLSSTSKFYGGRAGNFSVYASLFGARVGVVSAVGRDSEGADYRKYLQTKGIVTDHLYESRKATTAKCFFFNYPDGRSSIFSYNSAIREERELYVSHAKGIASNVAHSVLYCTSPDQEMNLAALSASNAATKAYAPSSNIYLHSTESIEKGLGMADMLFINEPELESLEKRLGAKASELMERFDIELIINTLGERGSRIMSRGGSVDIPPCRPEKVVDTTGAGDAFAGAFLANYLKTKDIASAGRTASALASFVVESVGAQTNIPNVKMVVERSARS